MWPMFFWNFEVYHATALIPNQISGRDFKEISGWFPAIPRDIKWKMRGGHVGCAITNLLLMTSNMAAMTSPE